ncbi:uncharacterized protein LOC127863594 isoform X5 [Dreissena polymorpha]|uniref:uncharacterized protein LOC127863594 isoform X5 n=1 Tax=Dreissena polymorpha TaxID=45954 RepID=UPI002264965B|nr:uncharacterized protein LOC127863594 isoform X5 [Dreissena polymorpha]XP_052259126.1 uncharacterized protein LOC127863594 isoform X5 [Dreissena polymorpha]XP_052259128.1 uncharacterized protein LOC127863594 isoform X5 [Dreissena polymorpha]
MPLIRAIRYVDNSPFNIVVHSPTATTTSARQIWPIEERHDEFLATRKYLASAAYDERASELLHVHGKVTIPSLLSHEVGLPAGSASTLSHDVTAAVAMTITCSDGTDQITSSYNVDIFDAVPVLTNFAGTSGPLGDLSPVGTSVQQFTITDQDDAISCSINAQEVAKFGITKVDTATGAQRFDVMTIATLDYDSATSYTITVTCTDAINPVTSSRTINLADDKPVFSGLPATLSPARNDGFQTAMLLCTFSVTDANDQIIITCLIQVSNFELFREFPAPMDSFFNLVPVKAPTFAIWVKASVTLDSASSLSSLTSSALTTDRPRIPLPKRSLFPYLTRNLKLVRWLCDAIGEVHNYGPGYDMFCDVTCDNSL